MQDQSRLEPFEASQFFADDASARPLPVGAIPAGRAAAPAGFYTGRTAGGELLEAFPFPVTEDILQQGQTQFGVFCTPCHGLSGEGNGIIVEHGFSPPPSFYSERLQQAPAGHFVEVMTFGVGQMYSYADRVPTEDRWAIAAYIQALQGRNPVD
ncbi:MAG TPA: cytochrome c [Anaerolineae bacterium]|nr:cytochrome c [Anaerolineae bacterium]